jgi:DNA-3-methyladenine glycosylase II
MSFASAAAELARRDRVMRDLVARSKPFRIAPSKDTHFTSLVESIMYQQLAGAAAAAIYGRFVAAVGGRVTPDAVLAASDESLRAAGLSGSKLSSIKDLAFKVGDGTVPLDGIERYGDDDIVRLLSVVRGIGRWTAEMFLIFQLRRLDVWPVDDYGVRKGYALAYRLPELPKPRALQEIGERFRPVRTAAAWYCWRSVDLAKKTEPKGRSAARTG